MKKLYIIITITVFCISLTGFAQTGTWSILGSGTTTNLLGISAPTTSVVYVSGLAGLIRKSSDGGATWNPQTSGSTQDLYSICFTDANNGYAVGNAGAALKTINGGATWTQMTIGTTESLRHVKFLDSNNGFITGGVSGGSGHGTILKTTNAGVSWTIFTTTTPGVIYSTFFTSSLVGYADDFFGTIYKTIDGGATWPTSVSSGSAAGLSILNFPSPAIGMASDQSGGIVRTNNSGASWNSVTTGTTTDYLSDIDFYDANNGFCVGGNASNVGIILSTTDAGLTWTTNHPGVARILRIDMVNSNLGFCAGNNGLIMKYSNTIGINETEKTLETFNAYPNPFTQSTTIDCSAYPFTDMPSMELFDIDGRLVSQPVSLNSSTFLIEKGNLSSGMYFYNVFDGKKLIGSGKVILE